MTKNERIASILLEAASLLREDNEKYESLNEGIKDLFKSKSQKAYEKYGKQKVEVTEEDKQSAKELYDKAVKILRPLVAKEKGFSIPDLECDGSMSLSTKTNKYHPVIYFDIINVDLWDRTPNARQDEEESQKAWELTSKFEKLIRPLASKYGFKVESDGDWDTWSISLVKWK